MEALLLDFLPELGRDACGRKGGDFKGYQERYTAVSSAHRL